ncbi:response regulator [Candidatus Binatia bacterium]|nr:response regulator [Candidatus Binatia bacterium]
MQRRLILVVEDDPRSRRLVHDLLEHAGYDIAEAASGEEGVRLARELSPALVILDFRLPGMDGITALGELRSIDRCRAIPVIAVTASAMPGDRARITAAGFDACEEKPIDVGRLVATVRRLLASTERAEDAS